MKSKLIFSVILLTGFLLGIYYHYLLEELSSYSIFSTITFREDPSPLWTVGSYILTHLFTILFTLSIFFIASIILLENRNPSRTVAWLVILTIFPVIGFIFYIFLGRNIRKERRFKDKTIDLQEQLQLFNIPYDATDDRAFQQLSSKQGKLVHLLLHNASLPMTRLNKVEILTNGEATFDRMFEALRKAKHHIHFVTFILRDDRVGNELKDILMAKAREGVKVRMIIDGLGSRHLSRRYKRELLEAGVELAIFSPILFPYLRKINYRNHRKITIIDGKVGFLGGLNVGDEYLGLNKKFGFWRDTHMRVEGDAVYFLQLVFLHDWRFTTNQYAHPEPEYFPEHQVEETRLVQIAASGPDSDWEYTLKVYFLLITQAKERIYITTPYLIPDDSIAMALKTAALSGVDVRIIVPGAPDHVVVHWASRSYYRELMEAGVKIYSYMKGFIHAKIIIADGQNVTIGTANFDIRSFHHNFEVSGVIYDPEVAARLEQDFLEDLSYSQQLQLDQIINRPIREKARESIARLMSPLL